MTDTQDPIRKAQAAKTFDQVASDYDMYRPSYPDALVEYILTQAHIPQSGRILEIGSGTGKATQLFASRGYELVGIEPGKNLAALAAQKFTGLPVRFDTTNFEDWPIQEQSFDLAFSAQAWHWVDPHSGYSKAAQALKDGGSLALFWNMYSAQSSGDVVAEFQEIYKQLTPHIMADNGDSIEDITRQRVQEILSSGEFGPVEVHQFPWQRRYTTAEHIGLIGTYSNHLLLPADTRQQLNEALANVIERHGGSFERQYLTVLYLAPKLAVHG